MAKFSLWGQATTAVASTQWSRVPGSVSSWGRHLFVRARTQQWGERVDQLCAPPSPATLVCRPAAIVLYGLPAGAPRRRLAAPGKVNISVGFVQLAEVRGHF